VQYSVQRPTSGEISVSVAAKELFARELFAEDVVYVKAVLVKPCQIAWTYSAAVDPHLLKSCSDWLVTPLIGHLHFQKSFRPTESSAVYRTTGSLPTSFRFTRKEVNWTRVPTDPYP